MFNLESEALSPTSTSYSTGGSSWYERYYRNYKTYKAGHNQIYSAPATRSYPQRSYSPSRTTTKQYYAPRSYHYSRTPGNYKAEFSGRITPTSISELTAVGKEVKMFDLSVTHKTFATDRSFVEAGNLNLLKFQLIDGGRVSLARNLSDFVVIVKDESGNSFTGRLDHTGRAKIYPKGLRIAKGEGLGLEVFLQLENEASFGGGTEAFRLKLVRGEISGESSRKLNSIAFVGRSSSDWVNFGRYYSGNEGFSSDTNTSVTPAFHIEGGILEAGTRNLVTAVKMESQYEDIIISSIRVRNTYGAESDNAVEMMQLVDLSAGGKILDETRLLGGEAQFDIGSDISIYRGRERTLGVFVKTSHDLSRVKQARLSIDFGANDIVARGLQSGRTLPAGFKVVNIDAKDFAFARSGGFVFEESGEKDFLAPSGGLSPVYRFHLKNEGSTPISVARISFDVSMHGMDWAGGQLDAGDVELRRRGFRSRLFTPHVSGDGRLVFDAQEALYLPAGARYEMILQLALDDLSGDDDWLRIQMLHDSDFERSNLSTIRSGGAHFIWSDHSGRPHSNFSDDWLNGKGLNLPLDPFLNKR